MKLCGYDWPQGGTKQVVYADDQGQVIELWVGLNGPWRYTSFTALMRRGVNNSSKEHSLEETRLKS